ncbi:nicotinate-nucleotide--dimethylbenzimidazole phosphoribosyltransferase [Azospirillum sp. RWY-5-1]|uniref:Nicotinate-nucleotide--dimethylbenzimidazole phosphoribosyltransferase n=1 Tax=Azospirillum oleiclasticum TaxID=2735135 RepID=A0ABX2THS4_9PROT|nr:nicotinate-nucleotide--dimethylbenzimidazole phosphoribosyltransferase [Azospirillum oleiclasticum]NYZ15914.1 nicotinate-nucleotide--dimethylbenzimidazole phosphoribosyltransferase [Azospirillum oleiclasticum]NYZ23607.1 nicotinate-nucleotide--dimethylbenzimidazole phosphoribosyltransferase [Azospirillum oleiclasticum]
MSNAQPALTFEEMRALVRNLPGPDLDSGTAALQRQSQLTKPPGSLGRLEDLAQWLATWQGRHPAELRRPRVAVFAANHGVVAQGVSPYPAAVTAQMVANFARGGAAVNRLCEVADAELRVYELDLDNPTRDFTESPAMDEEECCRAMAYGMMAAEMGVQLLGLGEMGIGNTTAAAALCCALFGGDARGWVGRGTGVDDAGFERKVAAVEAGLAANPQARDDPFEALRRLGGFEFAAIAGAVLAARMARMPVVLDGYACTAAAAVLFKADRRALDHCVVAHRSVEPGHSRLLEAIGKDPILDLGMRLGEGSGAALAIPILKAAAECHAGMATFAEAGVSDRA